MEVRTAPVCVTIDLVLQTNTGRNACLQEQQRRALYKYVSVLYLSLRLTQIASTQTVWRTFSCRSTWRPLHLSRIGLLRIRRVSILLLHQSLQIHFKLITHGKIAHGGLNEERRRRQKEVRTRYDNGAKTSMEITTLCFGFVQLRTVLHVNAQVTSAIGQS